MTISAHEFFDPVGAAERVSRDMKQDWVKDAIRKADILERLSSSPEIVARHLDENASPRRGLPIPVPKSSLTCRPAVELRTIDRVAYQSLVDTFMFQRLSELPDRVFGWRYKRNPQNPSDIADNAFEWRRYEEILESEWDAGAQWVLVTDVAGFFQSIPHGLLRERLGLAQREVRNALFDYLRIWRPDGIGVPQRVLASSLLANCYLEPLDWILRDYRSLRWMDDVVVFCDTRREGTEAMIRIDETLDDLGLFPNAAKTELIPFNEAQHLVDFIRFRNVEYQLEIRDPEGEAGLLEAWEAVRHDLEHADRTKFSFCITRFMEQTWDLAAADILGALDEIPHLSDHASRYLRTQLREPHVLRLVTAFLKSRRNLFKWQEYRLATLFWHSDTIADDQLVFVKERAASGETHWAARGVYLRAVAKHGSSADGRTMVTLAERETNFQVMRALIVAAAESGSVTRRQLRAMARDDTDLMALVQFLNERGLQVPALSF